MRWGEVLGLGKSDDRLQGEAPAQPQQQVAGALLLEQRQALRGLGRGEQEGKGSAAAPEVGWDGVGVEEREKWLRAGLSLIGPQRLGA